jgi:hypothetical protein
MSERLVMGILSVVEGRTACGGPIGMSGSTLVLVLDGDLPMMTLVSPVSSVRSQKGRCWCRVRVERDVSGSATARGRSLRR